LEHKFGKSLASALKRRDQDEIQTLLADTFSGEIPVGERVDDATNWWQESAQTVADESTAADRNVADQEALADYLVAQLDGFADIESTRLRVLSIQPAAADRWKLRLLITARGAATVGGPISYESTHDVVCRFTNDEEIESGRIVVRWRVLQTATRQAPAKFMEEVTEQVGLNDLRLEDNWQPGYQVRQYRFQMAADDFNRDGFPDLAVCCIEGRQDLLLSDGGNSFHNATLEVGLPPIHSGHNTYLATWLDFDNDGFSDLLLGNRLFHNMAGRRFEDITSTSGLNFDENVMGCVVADYDTDGLLDLYVLY